MGIPNAEEKEPFVEWFSWPSDATIERLLRGTPYLYISILLISFATSLIATLLLTVDPDEAWNLISMRAAFGDPIVGSTALAAPTMSSAGLYLLSHGLLGLWTENIVAHRMISVVATALLSSFVWIIIRTLDVSRDLRWAGIAAFVAAPSLLWQSSLAMAEGTATLLVVVAFAAWAWQDRVGARALLLASLAMGLAVATRINCLPYIPILAGCFWLRAPNAHRWKAVMVAIIVPLSIMIASTVIYVWLNGTHDIVGLVTYMSQSTGIGSARKSAFDIAKFLLIADGIIPLSFAAVLTGYYVILARRTMNGPAVQFGSALCAAALLGLISWAYRSPLPHLRYLWPSIGLFWIASILAILPLIERAGLRPRILCHIGVIALCSQVTLTAVFYLSDGETFRILYELNRQEPLRANRCWGCARRAQNAMVDRLTQVSTDVQLFSSHEEMTYPETYLAHRPIGDIKNVLVKGHADRLLVIVPTANWHDTPEFTAWRRINTHPVWNNKGYALERIDFNAGPPPTN